MNKDVKSFLYAIIAVSLLLIIGFLWENVWVSIFFLFIILIVVMITQTFENKEIRENNDNKGNNIERQSKVKK